MKGIIVLKYLLVLTVIMGSNVINGQEEITTYYFIRHAEKDRSDKANKDPDLIDKGNLRALNWSIVLKDVSLDAVYSTDYNRTKQTALPTALNHNLKIQLYDPRDMYNEAFKNATKGKTTLIVGHSNTTPSFVNKVLGKETYPAINDLNNGNLYVVTVMKDLKTVQLLHID